MAETKKLDPKKQLFLLLLVAIVGFVLLLIFQRQTLLDTWETLKDAKIGYVLLLPFLQVLNYFFIGTYYRKMFELFDAKISIPRSWGVVAAMNFVNQVLPSGGLSGITYLAYGFRANIESGKTALIQVGRYIFAFGSYALLAPIAFFLLVQGGRSDDISSLLSTVQGNAGALAVVVAFVVIMGVGIGSIFNRKLAHHTGQWSLSVINWVNRTILRRTNDIKLGWLRRINDEFHEGSAIIRGKGFRALRPSIYMMMSACVELSIVYVALLAVGGNVGIGPVFLAFIAANVVGVVSVIPGDVGVHEATVIATLVAFGVDGPVAVSTTLLYRVFNKVIFLPVGFFFYARILKPAIDNKKVA